MDQTEEIPAPVKKQSFVGRHKVAIAVIATSAFWIALQRLSLKGHNDFLKEKGLYDEYYYTEEDE